MQLNWLPNVDSLELILVIYEKIVLRIFLLSG